MVDNEGAELIARLEAASEGSRELDEAIHSFIGSPHDGRGLVSFPWPSYTTSLDAALMLVPEGWVVEDLFIGADKTSCVDLLFSGKPAANGSANTAPLAVCIAALKARASKER